MDEKKDNTRLECGCVVCNGCLREYATAEVLERGRADVPCPVCDKLIDELTMTALLKSDPKDTVPYRKYVATRPCDALWIPRMMHTIASVWG